MNPEAEYHSAEAGGALQALQAENSSLREQLAKVEQGAGQWGRLTCSLPAASTTL